MENAQTLTPEEKAEFDTPLLEAFALSYKRFKHSSPYTTRRRMFRYFEPLPPESLPEFDILYGENREAAYKRLLNDFEACLLVGAFDKLFEGKRYYWQSRTMPDLVLLRKWIDKYKPDGKEDDSNGDSEGSRAESEAGIEIRSDTLARVDA